MLAPWSCKIATTFLHIHTSGQLTGASGKSVHIYHLRRPVSPFARNVYV